MAKKAVSVSVIIVYFNTPSEILKALSSIKNAMGNYVYEIVIVNNYSSKPLPKQIKSFSGVRIINNEQNMGYGKALNQGAKAVKGKYLVLSNSDIIFLSNSIAKMIKKLENNPSIGIIGPQFLDLEQRVQMVGSDMPFLPQAIFAFSFFNKFFPNNPFSKKYYLSDFDRNTEKEIPALCGACLVIKKSMFERIKGFDERFFMYFEEADICYRVKMRGYKPLYYPTARVIHLIGKSSSDKKWIQRTFEQSRYKFLKKYHNIILATFGEGVLRGFRLVGGLL